jgi:hypothetical protein
VIHPVGLSVQRKKRVRAPPRVPQPLFHRLPRGLPSSSLGLKWENTEMESSRVAVWPNNDRRRSTKLTESPGRTPNYMLSHLHRHASNWPYTILNTVSKRSMDASFVMGGMYTHSWIFGSSRRYSNCVFCNRDPMIEIDLEARLNDPLRILRWTG